MRLPIYAAALTRFEKPKDPITHIHTPILPEDPGIVHIVRATVREVAQHDPWFIEDPEQYRAGLCGARVKVILAMPLRSDDPEGCWDCRRLLDAVPRGGVDYWDRPTAKEIQRRRKYAARFNLTEK